MAEEGAAKAPPSSHRLPTVSASEALRNVELGGAKSISIGVDGVDSLFRQSFSENDMTTSEQSGLPRGQVTEIYGPPGVGKTTFCMQAAVSVLNAGGKVMWIDTATTLPGPRLRDIVHDRIVAKETDASNTAEECLARFSHYVAPTLPHLMALLLSVSEDFPPADTRMVIVDCLSTLIDSAYVRRTDERLASNRNENARWLSGRRQAIIADIGSKFSKLAALRNSAVLVTSNVVTKVKGMREAVLQPALIGEGWDDAVGTSLLLFRDWLPAEADAKVPSTARSGRFMQIVKLNAETSEKTDRRTVPFTIEQGGIRELPVIASRETLASSTLGAVVAGSKKRPFDEVALSDDDGSAGEYGWSEDEELAAEGLVEAYSL